MFGWKCWQGSIIVIPSAFKYNQIPLQWVISLHVWNSRVISSNITQQQLQQIQSNTNFHLLYIMGSFSALYQDTCNPSTHGILPAQSLLLYAASQWIDNESYTLRRKKPKYHIDIGIFQSFQYPSHCKTLGIQRWVKNASPNIVVF